MPYLETPPWAKVLDRTVLALQYAACVCMGLLAVFIREEPGISLVGWVILASSIPCVLGAITGRWEVESVALVPLASALLMALVLIDAGPANVVWWMVFAFVAALVRQWIRLLLQILADIRRRRLLHRLDDGGPA
ncbi:hypothetical protein ACFQHV_00940 [Promicromonospora thailandica]|uniref:Uncharacterized protein n=1 Tax=Promicromonospora thailandica TaxID=765201 RepID=A0A9X2G4H2_9MICO|nr:hypothetical protein [Promicromonospora thailandica]MCP2265580.1 hypothetical protein [Promicromonospora thailandica]BFF17142.1 hypothetical protein GCM10025730_06630 [Promicromonospora thailandica]